MRLRRRELRLGSAVGRMTMCPTQHNQANPHTIVSIADDGFGNAMMTLGAAPPAPGIDARYVKLSGTTGYDDPGLYALAVPDTDSKSYTLYIRGGGDPIPFAGASSGGTWELANVIEQDVEGYQPITAAQRATWTGPVTIRCWGAGGDAGIWINPETFEEVPTGGGGGGYGSITLLASSISGDMSLDVGSGNAVAGFSWVDSYLGAGCGFHGGDATGGAGGIGFSNNIPPEVTISSTFRNGGHGGAAGGGRHAMPWADGASDSPGGVDRGDGGDPPTSIGHPGALALVFTRPRRGRRRAVVQSPGHNGNVIVYKVPA